MVTKNTQNTLVTLQHVPVNPFPINAEFLMVNVIEIYSILEATFSVVENVSGSLKPARYKDIGPAILKYSQYH